MRICKRNPRKNQTESKHREIPFTCTYKYLGMTIDYKLNFLSHLNVLEEKVNKITQKTFMFDKNIVPPDIFRDMFKSYVIPHFLYCVDIIKINQKAFEKLDEIYRRAAKKIIGIKKNHSYNNIIQLLALPDLQTLQ